MLKSIIRNFHTIKKMENTQFVKTELNMKLFAKNVNC